jgi:hypothetical protein
VLGNVAVLLAALGVFGTGTGWPDVIVATGDGRACITRKLVGDSPVSQSLNELRVAEASG